MIGPMYGDVLQHRAIIYIVPVIAAPVAELCDLHKVHELPARASIRVFAIAPNAPDNGSNKGPESFLSRALSFPFLLALPLCEKVFQRCNTESFGFCLPFNDLKRIEKSFYFI